MSLVGRFFGKHGNHSEASDRAAADRERSMHFSAPAAQTDEERDGVRARMEAELTAQRERRQV
jgi:hypothetical protein